MSTKLGDILLRLGYVSEQDVMRALEIQKSEGNKRKLGEILTELFINKEDLAQALTMQSRTRPDAGLDIVSRILKQQLQQDDIKEMLQSMSRGGQEDLMDRVAGVLDRVVSFLEISNQLFDILSLDNLLTNMISIVTESLEADRATLFLNDPETSELYSRVLNGTEMKEIRFPNHLGIAGSVFTSGKPVIIDDAYSDSRFNQDVDRKTGYRTRNILCAPIRAKDKESIGVVQVLNKNEGDFSFDDLTLIEVLSSQASAALQNAQLLNQVKKARDEETKLLEVTTAISSELHLEPLLQKIMTTTTEILDADRSTLFMNDEKTGELWSMVAQGTASKEIRFPNHLGIAGSVFTKRETVNIPDAYADSRFNQDVDKRTGYRTRSILCMPVINKDGKAIGVTQVLNKRGGPFSKVDENRLRAFSAQASIAIENAKLFDDVLNMKNYNESILESMSNGVLTLDEDSRVVKCNAAAQRILVMGEHALIGQSIFDLFTDANQWVSDSVRKVLGTGAQDISQDTEIRVNDGQTRVAINLTTVPLMNVKGGHMGLMLVFEDITKEKRLKTTMARYMTKEVADKLLESGEEMLGGQAQTATVLFSDIRSFTSLSERWGAAETVSMLNEYFTIMVDVLFTHSGVLDKYVGDAIMAVFGAPFTSEDDADKACRAAVDMMSALREFNAERLREGKESIDIGIGLNTDEVLSGNIGSIKRMDYTVIGDGVNLASRLEGANKYYGTKILISEFTFNELRGQFMYREADRIRVKGKQRPVGVYELLDYHNEHTFPHMGEVIGLYLEGLAAYRAMDWSRGVDLFEQAVKLNPEDGLSRMYAERCRKLMQNPPEGKWDCVWTMTDK